MVGVYKHSYGAIIHAKLEELLFRVQEQGYVTGLILESQDIPDGAKRSWLMRVPSSTVYPS